MPVGAAIGIGSAVSAGASIISGNKAAKASSRASDAAVAEERRQYDLTRSDFAPWRDIGRSALYRLAQAYGVPTGGSGGTGRSGPVDGIVRDGFVPSDGGMSDAYGGFFTSPGYRFRTDEGIKALERSASARGRRSGPVYGLSGPAAKAIARYGQGLAASEYDSYASRLAQLAGFGQGATGSTAAAGAQAAQGASAARIAAGDSRASSYLNTGSAISNSVGNMVGAYLYSHGRAGG